MAPPSSLSPRLTAGLRALLGADRVIVDPDRLLVYESDGLTSHRSSPAAVILPSTEDEVARALVLLAQEGVSFVPRGAGTGLSGGAVATQHGVVVGLARMHRILELDPEGARARVEPGVVNAHLTAAAAPHGLCYPPDPSSQSACTLGGNVAENSGGPHCLKYGVTGRYVTGLTLVLPDGRLLRLDEETRERGLDLISLIVGSEGCLGVVTDIRVELAPIPEGVRTLLALFDQMEDAARAVTEIIARGLLPAALEIMDAATIRAVEASVFAAGYPTDVGAALVVEVDGVEAGLDAELEAAGECCRRAGARELRLARTGAEREALWRGRKKAFGAMGRLAPDLLVQDATVPRSRVPGVLTAIGEIGRRHGLQIANVFHAGDGNLHPNILFDRRNLEEVERVERASTEIMQVCVDAGGTITGEHGVGADKRAYMELIHSREALLTMGRVRRVFDPGLRCNPGKVLPDEIWAEVADDPAAAESTRPTPRRTTPSPRLSGDALLREHLDPAALELPGVVAPASAEEAAEFLALASSEGWTVRIVDGSEGVSGAIRPAGFLRLSSHRLACEWEHEPADLMAVAGAGLGSSAASDRMAQAGQWLALDPPGWGDASLGSVFARGSTGPLAAGFGHPREHLLGATLVTGDGRVLELGGRVVKNVAGFDLLRLAAGSRGTLGLVTRVILRAHPLPEVDRTVTFHASPFAAATDLAQRIRRARIPAAAMEQVEARGTAGDTLAVRLMGSLAAVDALGGRCAAAAGGPFERLEGDHSRAFWLERARNRRPLSPPPRGGDPLRLELESGLRRVFDPAGILAGGGIR